MKIRTFLSIDDDCIPFGGTYESVTEAQSAALCRFMRDHPGYSAGMIHYSFSVFARDDDDVEGVSYWGIEWEASDSETRDYIATRCYVVEMRREDADSE